MKQEKTSDIVSRRAALVLNVVIVSAYVAIATLTHSPWAMFAGFILLAVLIRCATLCWMLRRVRRANDGSRQSVLAPVALNLALGLLFCAGLLGALWWVGHFWLSGIKVIVPCVAVFIAYKSTFPVWSSNQKAGGEKTVEGKGSDS